MSEQLTPEAREKLENLQAFQSKAQQVTVQKHHTEAQLAENKSALSVLSKAEKEATLYRHVGNLLVETDSKSAEEDLNQRVEALEVRLQTLNKQSERIQKQFETLQKEIQEILNIS